MVQTYHAINYNQVLKNKEQSMKIEKIQRLLLTNKNNMKRKEHFKIQNHQTLTNKNDMKRK